MQGWFFFALQLKEVNVKCSSDSCRAETNFKLQAPVLLSDSVYRLPALWCVEEKNIQGNLRLCFAFQPMGLGSCRKSRGCCFWASLKHHTAQQMWMLHELPVATEKQMGYQRSGSLLWLFSIVFQDWFCVSKLMALWYQSLQNSLNWTDGFLFSRLWFTVIYSCPFRDIRLLSFVYVTN